MNGGGDIPLLERPVFFDGQLLDAADFSVVAHHQRELRWLHNRSLHGWGVVRGLAVRGARGDRDVDVTAGYALDCRGRELLVPEPARLPVPPVVGGSAGSAELFYLTVSYVDDADLPVAETRAGACGASGAVRLSERARLRWQSPYEVDPTTRFRRGLDVLLASVEIADCRLAAPPSLELRRDLPPPCGPPIAAGVTVALETGWRLYPAAGPVLGVEATVDTSSGGFSRTPLYHATVVGQRVVPAAAAPATDVIDGAASVESATTTSFVLRVLLPRDVSLPPYRLNPPQLLTPTLPARLRAELGWRVSWVGVEV